MSFTSLRRFTPATVPSRGDGAIDRETARQAGAIVAAVREGGEPALLACARRYDGWDGHAPWLFDARDLADACDAVDADTRALLERTAARIAAFAGAQRRAMTDMVTPVPGGRAGHHLLPMERAGCYAPSGRFPLPSSLLMSVVTARVAGVSRVHVATPNPSPLMRAAAAIAGADALLAVGGAHAIAALAYGVGPLTGADIVVGPGNRWVTAAKRWVAGDVAIDMLAGPSELVVLADASADADIVAADLLAQAEHDVDALPILVTTASRLPAAVDAALRRQLATLPTRAVAMAALANGFTICCDSLTEAIRVVDALAPEHLQLAVSDPAAVQRRVRHAGALFLGIRSAEVFADYGVGPNHVLPTGRGARRGGGLSVLHFLRARAWLEIDEPAAMARDAAALARLEGLEAHARAAERRREGATAGRGS